MRNNKGFSLVELIVAFAITAIAGLAVFGLMSAGTNHFTRTGNDVGLQYEQQVVVNRLRDVLLEASDALSYDESSKELVVYSQEDMGPTAPGALTHVYKYRVTKIYLDGTVLRFATTIYDDVDSVTASGLYVADTDDRNMGIFGEEVKDVSFDLSKIDEGKIGFKLTFESNGKEITSDQIVTLRNRVLNSDDPDEIFVNNTTIIPSFIQSIRIKRNDVDITGGNTEIVKDGSETVAVPFTYEITASEYSEYPYVGRWSLLDTSNADFTVDSATGIVTVGPSVAPGTTNILKVESIDDTSKYATCQITVTDTGTYPVDMTLVAGDYIDYVGYREYNIHPVVTYSDGSQATESTLCRWEIAPVLPDGCVFDAGENKFTALPTANGMTVVFAATLKAPKSDGTYIYKTLQLPIEGVGEYIPNQKLNLSGVDSMYNCRGKSSTVLASWTNSSSTDFVYHWRVSSYGDSWSTDDKDPERRKFSKTVSFDGGRGVTFTSDGDDFYSAGKGYSYIYVNTQPWLDWSKEYQIKVECYATDDKGNKYGIGNEVDRNYTGPVSMLVTYEPVKIILTPVSVFHQNNDSRNDKKFIVSQDLKRVSNGKKDGAGNYQNASKPYSGNTVRTFEINARGVYYDSTNTSNVIVYSSSNVNHQYNPKFTFYNSPNENATVSNNTIKDYFKVCNYTDSNWTIGFEALMKNDKFKKYYKTFNNNALSDENRPNYVTVTYNAWDSHGNIVDTYYQTGSNYYNDSDITNTRNYYFRIVYDPNKLDDPNYIEVY